MEVLNYLYPFVSTEYITVSAGHAAVYIVAGMWSVFGRLPSVFFIFALVFIFILCLRRLYRHYTAGNTAQTVCPSWFLVCICFIDLILLVALVGVVGMFIKIRSLTLTSYLSVYYAPTISSDPILWRSVLHGLEELGFQFRVDSISAVFVFIVVVVIDLCLVVYKEHNSGVLVAVFLLLKASAVACFCSANLFTFTVFMEMSAILTLFVILSSSGTKKLVAGLYYFVYSSISGFILIFSTVGVIEANGSTTFRSLRGHLIPWGEGHTPAVSVFLFLIVAALLIKIPTGPFYHWLLKAHVEASTAGSLVLAAIMLKMPAYGLIRIIALCDTTESHFLFFFVIVCCLLAITACTSQMWWESDWKRIVALSSVVHMSGFVIFTQIGDLSDGYTKIPTALLLLIAHSFASSVLFVVCGAISARYHTRDFLQTAGLFAATPVLSVGFLFGIWFAGGFPLGVVFMSEVYAISTAVYSQNLLLSSFILVAYSLVFLRFVALYLYMLPGEQSPGRVSVDFSGLEVVAIFVLVVLLFVLAFYSLEISSTLLLSIWPKLMPRQLVSFIVLHPAKPFGRFESLRSFRWGWAGIPRAVVKNTAIPSENPAWTKRRLRKYVLNAIDFRRKIGFVGRPAYSGKPIRPLVLTDSSWKFLYDFFEDRRSKGFGVPFITIREAWAIHDDEETDEGLAYIRKLTKEAKRREASGLKS